MQWNPSMPRASFHCHSAERLIIPVVFCPLCDLQTLFHHAASTLKTQSIILCSAIFKQSQVLINHCIVFNYYQSFPVIAFFFIRINGVGRRFISNCFASVDKLYHTGLVTPRCKKLSLFKEETF